MPPRWGWNVVFGSFLQLIPLVSCFDFGSIQPMSEWLVVVILGIIEGITEFLPISSTGHMLLAQNWLPHPQSEAFFAIIQCGAVLAVLLVFSQRLKEMFTKWNDPATRDYFIKLMTAFVLTGIAGLILKKLN